jgi:rhamnogalacturonan endolyase
MSKRAIGRFASLIVTMAVVCAAAENSLRFEAEDVTEPADAWAVNRHSDTKWNLWSTDKDAHRKWSEGVVLQSPRVMSDRGKPEDGAPPLHAVVKKIPAGKYYVLVGGVGRPLGISLDGKTWRKLERSSGLRDPIEIGADGFEIWLDDRYASTTNPGSCYFDFLEFTPLPDPKRKPPVGGFANERITERLDRGVVALPRGDREVYVGWRLLKEDPQGIAFNVYRRAGEREATKLNAKPLRQTTDFTDSRAATGENVYTVVPVLDGEELAASKEAVVDAADAARNHVAIKLDGNHAFQKCGIADLNGDGAYDFVIKQPNANIDPYEKYWKRSPETYQVEAYLADGKFLWRYDLGWAIERGIWYSPMVAHDLDGDGQAEVCLKAGEGDPREEDGRVRTGSEFLLVLDGMTGKERARVNWPARELFPSYNRASRNQMCVAYLDGKTPHLIVVRGTYDVIQARAYQFHNERLTEVWSWSDAEEGPRYRGQGAHSMHAVDVDGDGRDEVFLGSAVLDDNGVGLWSTGLGHPDHHYVGDIDPSNPGLEVYYGMETRQAKNGCCLVDAQTGEVLWGLDFFTRHVHSTGMCADLDPKTPGRECYSSDTDNQKKSNVRWLFDAKGNVLREDLDWGFGLRTIHWDADPQRELLRGNRLLKYKGDEFPTRIEGKVVAFADILGDWREELIVSDSGELRVYTTTIPAKSRHACLMQDPIYRMDVCIQAMGYTQCPMTTKILDD